MPRGPRPPSTRSTDREAIDQRRIRALSEPLEMSLLGREPYIRVEVRNPVRSTRYVTLWPRFPEREPAFCTCTDFARRGLGDCKHLEAAWRWLSAPRELARPETEPKVEVDLLWGQLDRAAHAPPPLRDRDIRQLSARAAALTAERRG